MYTLKHSSLAVRLGEPSADSDAMRLAVPRINTEAWFFIEHIVEFRLISKMSLSISSLFGVEGKIAVITGGGTGALLPPLLPRRIYLRFLLHRYWTHDGNCPRKQWRYGLHTRAALRGSAEGCKRKCRKFSATSVICELDISISQKHGKIIPLQCDVTSNESILAVSIRAVSGRLYLNR